MHGLVYVPWNINQIWPPLLVNMFTSVTLIAKCTHICQPIHAKVELKPPTKNK